VVDARNVLNDAGAATTAPRPDPAEDEVTLPRTATPAAGAVEPGAVDESKEPGDDRS